VQAIPGHNKTTFLGDRPLASLRHSPCSSLAMDSSSGSSQTSAWGGFLKKAMEGVEQQLDRVLENPPPKGTNPRPVQLRRHVLTKGIARDAAAAQTAARKENVVSGSLARASPMGPVGGGRMTLQERLAASIAKSRTGSPVVGSPKKSSDEPPQQGISRSSSSLELEWVETNGLGSQDAMPGSLIRTDTPRAPSSPSRDESPAVEVKDVPEAKTLPVRTETPDIAMTPSVDDSPDPAQSIEAIPKPDTPAPSERTSQESAVQIPSVPPLPPDTDPAILELISQLRNDLETCESRRMEEAEQSSSRISSLEQKLKIVSQSSLEAARTAASDPSATPLAAKLAEREEKIALLLDEGSIPPHTNKVPEKDHPVFVFLGRRFVCF
jgi:TATA element modulatory factor